MKETNWKEFVIKNLSNICSVVLIITLFVGQLFTYGEKFGKYTDTYGISGYHLIFNGSTFYAVLLLLVPLLLLFGHHFEKLKSKQKLIRFVAPMISLAILMVMKFNLRDIIGNGNAAAASYAVSFNSGFGLSGWLYLLSSLILIGLGAIGYFNLNVNEETIKKAVKDKNINSLK